MKYSVIPNECAMDMLRNARESTERAHAPTAAQWYRKVRRKRLTDRDMSCAMPAGAGRRKR
jgi:hypothetical protein